MFNATLLLLLKTVSTIVALVYWLSANPPPPIDDPVDNTGNRCVECSDAPKMESVEALRPSSVHFSMDRSYHFGTVSRSRVAGSSTGGYRYWYM